VVTKFPLQFFYKKTKKEKVLILEMVTKIQLAHLNSQDFLNLGIEV
jgi:hypothetical protein